MFAVYKRELFKFFTSTVAYLVIAVFLTINSLLLWVFEGNNNILNNPYASLDSFFNLSPWLLAILIPAISMSMFSEENKQGTLELLLTHPISASKIYFAKLLSALSLITITLLPTLLYVYSIYELSLPVGDIDLGAITASYFALILISAVFTSIGLFASIITSNQIVSFIVGIIISIFIFAGFEYISFLDLGENFAYTIKGFGMSYHFENMALGVIDLFNFIYFISLISLFSFVSIVLINKNKLVKHNILSYSKNFSFLILLILVLNYLSIQSNYRLDFTKDKRFTLSEQSINLVKELDSNINVRILLGGDLPVGFKKLEFEASRVLKDFRKYNHLISYKLGDPNEINDSKQKNESLAEIQKLGISPINLEVNKSGEKSSKLIFPWAIVSGKGKSIKVNLLKNKIGLSPEKQLNNSIENIEFALIDAINKVNNESRPKIAVLKGHNELNDAYLASFLSENREYYDFERLFLNSSKTLEEKQNQISTYDLIMIVKPSNKFEEEEKLLLDQFIMNGGKSLWLLDAVFAEMDSLQKDGRMLAFPRELSLGDMLFKYGARVNAEIVKDIQFAPIKLASGNLGSNVQYHTLPWPYYPLSIPDSKHPIVKNIEAVKFQFASSIDTISNTGVKKEVLLKSSEYSDILKVPNFISLSEVQEEVDQSNYKEGSKILGLLLEGEFNSSYKNRVLPFELNTYKSKSSSNKMIVYSDGDLIANQFQNSTPLALGYDKWFNKTYGNGELLQNSISYLLDNNDLLSVKKKELRMQLINKSKAKNDRTFWQLINLVLPLSILALIGLLFSMYRRKKYRK